MLDSKYGQAEIVATLPKPWEEEHGFHDVLYEWMERAPWLAISAAAHLLVFFIIQAIPWDAFVREEPPEFVAQLQTLADEPFDEPEDPIEPEVEDEPLDEPVLTDAELSDHAETEDPQDFESTQGDPDFSSDAPFDSEAMNDVIGFGGGAGGKFGGRIGGRNNLGKAGGSGTEQALEDALRWLRAHQDEDGHWDADDFAKHCPPGDPCEDPGHSVHDVGLTGLALLAFLGDGHTESGGAHRDVVARGISWLKKQQNLDTGLIGDDSSKEFLYDHAIATLAICEAYYFSTSPRLKRAAQTAIHTIVQARNPYLAWRYRIPPNGENDTSVTGWMVLALTSARDAGLVVDEEALEGARAWIDQVTDPGTGRVGYDARGTFSSRTPANEHFPREKGEAMTAVGLLCRFFLDEDPDESDVMRKHADLLLHKLPEWDPEGFGTDMYYWYYGSYAMFQMGGSKYWEPWNKALKSAVLESQRRNGHAQGSWDPIGPWGGVGGRVYSTSLMALCLEVYFRYGRVLGAR